MTTRSALKTLAILLTFAFSPLHAQDKDNAEKKIDLKQKDNIIACGITFKTQLLLSGSCSDGMNHSPDNAIDQISTLKKDLEHLSDTPHGKMLKQKGTTLLDSILTIYTLTSQPMKNGDEGKADTKKLQLALINVGMRNFQLPIDPAELATAISKSIKKYGNLASMPSTPPGFDTVR